MLRHIPLQSHLLCSEPTPHKPAILIAIYLCEDFVLYLYYEPLNLVRAIIASPALVRFAFWFAERTNARSISGSQEQLFDLRLSKRFRIHSIHSQYIYVTHDSRIIYNTNDPHSLLLYPHRLLKIPLHLNLLLIVQCS